MSMVIDMGLDMASVHHTIRRPLAKACQILKIANAVVNSAEVSMEVGRNSRRVMHCMHLHVKSYESGILARGFRARWPKF